ncbi:MAG TPA: MBL fold metallo-hydrolase [Polyangiaceae bacterium]|nr:MBL fold metallo-hydrolase [Polyangiaceae bacterium]
MTTDKRAPLSWDVFVAPAKPVVTDDLPPDGHKRTWSPTSATLIAGERDAVLVDPLMTLDEARALADWVFATGKNLTTVYVTHGHGDHFFGASVVLDRFPGARLVAMPAVVERMRRQAAPEFVAEFWASRFPGQIPERLLLADPLAGNTIRLEGHDLVVVELGHTDTDQTTCLHVPSLGLVVAGDAAYNDVHLYLAESNPHARGQWIAALDAIESLRPRAVVAGHKRPGNDDSPRILEETRQYIRDFGRVADAAVTAQELYERMLDLYPDRVNPGALWSSARALVPASPMD